MDIKLEPGAEAEQSSTNKKPTPRRKRENRYADANPTALARRRAQNRASQKAHRERKNRKIKDLEQTVMEITQLNDSLGQAYASLQAMYIEMFQMSKRGGASVPEFPCSESGTPFSLTTGGRPAPFLPVREALSFRGCDVEAGLESP